LSCGPCEGAVEIGIRVTPTACVQKSGTVESKKHNNGDISALQSFVFRELLKETRLQKQAETTFHTVQSGGDHEPP
jgi:hypothetical protein